MTNQAPALRPNAALAAEQDLIAVLQHSLYPGAQLASVQMVLSYCRAANLDPMQKPVHIVPVWDSKLGATRDVVMPGINLYRTQAARTGQFAGMSEPEFGPTITEKIGGVEVSYPEWCRVVVKRLLPNGFLAEFPATEFWIENYAAKGGKERSVAPNAMWMKRIRGQISKCAEAQALRRAFPEIAGAPTADEMEGKSINDDAPPHIPPVVPRKSAPVEDATPASSGPRDDPQTGADQDVGSTEEPSPRSGETKPFAGDTTPATEGEIAHIKMRANASRANLAEVLADLAIDRGEDLAGLTKAEFKAIKARL